MSTEFSWTHWLLQAFAAACIHAVLTALYVGGLWATIVVFRDGLYQDNPMLVGDLMFYALMLMVGTIVLQALWGGPLIALAAIGARRGRIKTSAVAAGVGVAAAGIALIDIAMVGYAMVTFRP